MSEYGGMLGAALLLSGGLFAALLPRGRRWAFPLTLGLATVCGLVLSRLVFWLCNAELYLGQLKDFSSLFRIPDGGLSMTGALLGAGIGCALASRMMKGSGLTFPELADALAPAAALFIACERCHEWILLKQNYGLDLAAIPVITAEGPFGPVLNTARISSLTALAILAALLAVRRKRPGDRAMLFLLLYSGGQVLLESLRQDLHMQWNFVHAQQLFAFLTLTAAMIFLSAGRKGKIRSLIVSLLAAGAIVFLEFALDGRVRPPFAFMTGNVKLWWYIVFAAVLAAYLAYGLNLWKSWRKEGTSP